MIEKKVKNMDYCSSNVLEEVNYSSKPEEKNENKYPLKNKIHLGDIFYRFKGRYLFPDRG